MKDTGNGGVSRRPIYSNIGKGHSDPDKEHVAREEDRGHIGEFKGARGPEGYEPIGQPEDSFGYPIAARVFQPPLKDEGDMNTAGAGETDGVMPNKYES